MPETTRVAERQSQRPTVGDSRAMTLNGSTLTRSTVNLHHPLWCHRSDCRAISNGPGRPPTMLHRSRTDVLLTADHRFELELRSTDDPCDPAGAGTVRVSMLTHSLHPVMAHNDPVLTVTETVDLIARLQAIVDAAMFDGRSPGR